MTMGLTPEQRIEQAVLAAHALASQTTSLFSEDAATDAACRAYLQKMITLDALQKKVAHELLGVWQPLGRVLMIISENDLLGTAFGFLAAYITGNRIRIKARSSIETLIFLKQFLKLGDDEVEFVSFKGGEQNDVALLNDVDGVMLAGGADLMAHYRAVARHPIRLIEFGPKLSAAAIGLTDDGQPRAEAELTWLAQTLLQEMALFQQQVCSAPRFVLLESEEEAGILFHLMQAQLEQLPPLNGDVRLLQSARHAELELLQRLKQTPIQLAFNAATGWGLSHSASLDPQLWFEKGLHLVSGELEPQLNKANELWGSTLQTLGWAGALTEQRKEQLLQSGFTRICPIGAMHKRPLSAAHDGFFELSALVNFISLEVG